MSLKKFAFAGFILPTFLLAVGVWAQTGPDLLVKPWDEGQAFDSASDVLLQSAGHTRETDETTRLSSYHLLGRFRLFPDNIATPRFGYDVLDYDVQTHDRSLPRHLLDASVGFAQPVAKLGDWFAAVTASAGYAGNSPFSDSKAYYPTADIIVGREFSKDRAIIIAFDFNGNRTFLPDTPIPGLAYADRLNEHFTYVLGLPYSSFTYEPITGFQIEAGYALLHTFDANIGYAFTKHFTLFSQYSDILSPFRISGSSNDRRLFFQTHDVEVGIRYSPTKLVRLALSGGWAFGQEFSNGFDSRDLTPLRHISDQPFVGAPGDRLLIKSGQVLDQRHSMQFFPFPRFGLAR